jgi:hypothetical protein
VRDRDGPICGVPKLTLVSQLQALLHEGRKILRELVEAGPASCRIFGLNSLRPVI